MVNIHEQIFVKQKISNITQIRLILTFCPQNINYLHSFPQGKLVIEYFQIDFRKGQISKMLSI